MKAHEQIKILEQIFNEEAGFYMENHKDYEDIAIAHLESGRQVEFEWEDIERYGLIRTIGLIIEILVHDSDAAKTDKDGKTPDQFRAETHGY